MMHLKILHRKNGPSSWGY